MVMCFVPDCKHYSERDTCRYYTFPKDQKEAKKWINAVRRADREPSKHSLVCSCHFKDGIKENGPSLFPRNSKIYMHFPPAESRKRKRKELKRHLEEKKFPYSSLSDMEVEEIKCGTFEQVICKEAFISLHGITKGRLRRITGLVSQGVSPHDRRGGRRQERCIADEINIQIRNHISSFPYRVAHYGKSQKKTRYLSAELSIHKMWMSYLQKHEPECYVTLKEKKTPAVSPIFFALL